MTKYAKVKDNKDLVRDMNSKAILNTNAQALFDHRRKKQAMAEMFNQAKKIDSMEKSIEELKQLVMTLVKNK